MSGGERRDRTPGRTGAPESFAVRGQPHLSQALLGLGREGPKVGLGAVGARGFYPPKTVVYACWPCWMVVVRAADAVPIWVSRPMTAS